MAYNLSLIIMHDKVYASAMDTSGGSVYIIPNPNKLNLYTELNVYMGEEWAVVGKEANLLSEKSVFSDTSYYDLDYDRLNKHESNDELVMDLSSSTAWTNSGLMALILKKIINDAQNYLKIKYFNSLAFYLPNQDMKVSDVLSKAIYNLEFDIKKISFHYFYDALEAFAQQHVKNTVLEHGIYLYMSFEYIYIYVKSGQDNPIYKRLQFGMNSLLKTLTNDDSLFLDEDNIPEYFRIEFIKEFFLKPQPDLSYTAPYFDAGKIYTIKPDKKKLRAAFHKIIDLVESSIKEILLTNFQNNPFKNCYVSGIVSSFNMVPKILKERLSFLDLHFLDRKNKNAIQAGAAYHHHLNQHSAAIIHEQYDREKGKIGMLTADPNYHGYRILGLLEEHVFPFDKTIVIQTSRANQEKLFVQLVDYRHGVSDASPLSEAVVNINEQLPVNTKISLTFSINHEGVLNIKAKNFAKKNNYAVVLSNNALSDDGFDIYLKDTIKKIRLIEI